MLVSVLSYRSNKYCICKSDFNGFYSFYEILDHSSSRIIDLIQTSLSSRLHYFYDQQLVAASKDPLSTHIFCSLADTNSASNDLIGRILVNRDVPFVFHGLQVLNFNYYNKSILCTSTSISISNQ